MCVTPLCGGVSFTISVQVDVFNAIDKENSALVVCQCQVKDLLSKAL